MEVANEPSASKKPKTFNLSSIDPGEVSVVGRPAIRRKFFLLKSDDEGSPMFDSDELKAIMETALENEHDLDEVMKSAKLSDKAIAAVKAALKTLQVHKDEIPADVMRKLAAMAGAGFPEPKPEGDDKDKPKPPFMKSVEGMSEKDRKAIQKQFDAEKVEREKLQKQVDEANDRERTREYVEKAVAYDVPNYTAKTLGPILKAFDDVYGEDSEQSKQFTQMVEGITEAMKKNALLTKVGKSGDGIVKKAEDELDAKAKALAKEKGIDFYDAYDLVCKEEKELYDRYLDEQE